MKCSWVRGPWGWPSGDSEVWMKMHRWMSSTHISRWPSWLSQATPCVPAGKNQWKRARRLLGRSDESAAFCAIISSRGEVIGLVSLDGREAWVRGEFVQPRRPVAHAELIELGKTITLPPLSSVPNGWQCTIINLSDKPFKIVPHTSDVGLPSPQGHVVDPSASSTNVRRGKGWRKSRAKLRSWLMRFQDWGSV